MAGSSCNIEKDVSRAKDILNEINENLKKTSKVVENLKTRITTGDLPTNNGLSILELKNQIFMSYLCNFSFTNLMKLSGKKFEDDPTIDRLIEQRVLIEKIRPLEFKLKNQINKYAKAHDKNSAASNMPKNSLDDISDGESDEGEKDNSTSEKQKSGVYKAPKISQVVYPGENEKDEVQEKKDARERRRYLESDMMADALHEYNEDPEEIHASNALKRKAQQKIKQIQKYEEDNFTRLVLTKKEKHMLEQVSTPGNLAAELLNFRSLDGIGKSKDSSKRKKKSGNFKKGSKKKRR